MIIITVENYSREFEGKFELACALADRFDQCVVVLPKRIVNDLGHRLNNLTIIHQSFSDSMNKVFSRKQENKLKLYILEEEILHRTISLSDQRAISSEIVNGFFATTQEDYDDLSLRYESKIIFTGHPRFNLYFKNDSIPTEINSIGEFSLFSSNFSMLAPVNENLLDSVIADNNFSEEREATLRNYIRTHLHRANKVLSYLKERSEFETIVYRPHPLENVEYARSFFQGSKVVVNKDYSIYPWLRAAKTLLHSNCTSAIEASLMGRSVGFIEPLDSELTDNPFIASDHYIQLRKGQASVIKNAKMDHQLFSKFWPFGLPDAKEEITNKLEVVEPSLRTSIKNVLLLLYGVILFHYRKLKTPKEQSRVNPTEMNRVLNSVDKLRKCKKQRIFEAVIVRKL